MGWSLLNDVLLVYLTSGEAYIAFDTCIFAPDKGEQHYKKLVPVAAVNYGHI